MTPDKKIISFIRKHHVLTLATSAGNQPWCSNMFYAYVPTDNCFVFTSDEGTKHICDINENAFVAASIVLETKIVGRIQGLQIQGSVRKVGIDEKEPLKSYLKKFPYAAIADLNLWILEPTHYKLTDNTLGFGKKIIWRKEIRQPLK